MTSLTVIERPHLPEQYNLTDGHAFRSWSPAEEAIIDRTPLLFRSLSRRLQPSLEREYVARFLELQNQTVDFSRVQYLQCPSASVALEILANYARLTALPVSLIEPTFDNLADIFKRHSVDLTAIPDEFLDCAHPGDLLLDHPGQRAFCLVTPNNPTGTLLSRQNLDTLIRHCRVTNSLLILDCSFRAYTPQHRAIDHYALLGESGIDYVIIEDTGKTWPTSELKAPFMAVSQSIFEPIYRVYTDLVLHASPFIIGLMTEFIRVSTTDQLRHVKSVVERNGRLLTAELPTSVVVPHGPEWMSVAWMQVVDTSNAELIAEFASAGVQILPGNHFYWSNHSQGSKFVRIALLRDADVFSRAVSIMKRVCERVAPNLVGGNRMADVAVLSQ